MIVAFPKKGRTNQDPIYAAIERHRAPWAELNARGASLGDSDAPEAKRELARLLDAVEVGEGELAGEVEPTTIAGVVALLRYVADLEREGKTLGEIFDAASLADALEKIAT
jgi:hypothetical protein